MRNKNDAASGVDSLRAPHSTPRTSPAFTLIELLVVISIIAVLAGFTFPVLKSVKKTQYISHTKAELGLLETAIQRYHDTLGFYPPSNPNYPATSNQAMFSPLYFELLGTTINSANGTYQTLDGSANIADSTTTISNAFGVGGFINCTKSGSVEDAPAAKNFLPGLKPNQFGTLFTNNAVQVALLLGSVGGPDPNYNPFFPNPNPSGVNPWRYVSPGTNNPNSYDLWIQLQISGKKYLVCNWSGQVQVNSPLP
jgi:prepilin-type N-terminal cleavage/methylation domain-containing protein